MRRILEENECCRTEHVSGTRDVRVKTIKADLQTIQNDPVTQLCQELQSLISKPRFRA